MLMHSFKLFILLFFISSYSIFALPLSFFSSEEQEEIKKGIIEIKAYSKKSDLIIAKNPEHFISKEIERFNPNYIAEALVYISSDKPKEVLETLLKNLGFFSLWLEIPYWSVQQETYYDLFTELQVLQSQESANKKDWLLNIDMQPFTPFNANISVEKKKNRLLFTLKNSDPIAYAYNGFKAVKSQNMRWYIEAEIDADGLLIYGIGVVQAFDMLGIMRNRLETSLVGRISSFFSWQFKNILPSTGTETGNNS